MKLLKKQANIIKNAIKQWQADAVISAKEAEKIWLLEMKKI